MTTGRAFERIAKQARHTGWKVEYPPRALYLWRSGDGVRYPRFEEMTVRFGPALLITGVLHRINGEPAHAFDHRVPGKGPWVMRHLKATDRTRRAKR